MKIKRYEIIKWMKLNEFRVIDKLKDDFVFIPLTSNSKKDLFEIMGEDMNKFIDSKQVHPGYLDKNNKEEKTNE